MKFDLGKEYAQLAEENLVRGVQASRRDARQLFYIAGGILGAWIAAADYYGFPGEVMISATIAIATMCLIWVLNSRTVALEADIIYAGGTIEWFGQNLLDRWDAKKQK